MRLFLLNPAIAFESNDVARRSKVSRTSARRELAHLLRAGLIKKKTFYAYIQGTRKGKRVSLRKKVSGYVFEEKFPYKEALSSFLSNATSMREQDVLKKLSGSGKLKFVVVAGIFVRDIDSRVDMLIVADAIKKPVLERAIKDIEANVGREIRYAVFSTADFKYRLSVYDRLIRDILDYPHQTVVDRFGISQMKA